MKAPAFWYDPAPGWTGKIISACLRPASFAFRAGAWLRRKLATPYRASVPLICIGNAVAGGAGKTPTALALAALLQGRGHRPVFVTRGYGGDGVTRQVDPSRHTAAQVGDEALLLASFAPTWAGRDRVAAIRQAAADGDVIIMDDGMQNPHVVPSCTILVIDGVSGIGNGQMMPAGPLREPFAEACRRAKAVLVIGERAAALPTLTLPVFHARLHPELPADFPRGDYFLAFAGIGRPSKFYDTARAAGLKLIATRDFADHHVYNIHDAERLTLQARLLKARLLTTTKDAVRLPPGLRENVAVLPVTLVFDSPRIAQEIADLVIGSCALQAQTLKP